MLLTKSTKAELLDAAAKKAIALIAEESTAGKKYTDETLQAFETAFLARVQSLFEAAFAEDRKKRYESDEPFVEIVSQTFSEEGGVQLRLDWNQPFIVYLKKNGFNGPTDEAIVDNWIVSLSKERIAEGGSEFK